MPITQKTQRKRALPLAILLAAAVTACGGDSKGITEPTPTPPPVPTVHTPNFVKLQSDPGDYIGHGRDYEYDQTNSELKLTSNGGYIRVSIVGEEWWNGAFQLPMGTTTIQPGIYSGVTRWPFEAPSNAGMDWGGEARGCNELTASFSIDSVTYVSGALASLDMRFEQHCEGAAPALRGTVHWRADDTTKAPGPTNPIPAGLWSPPEGWRASSGNAVYVLAPYPDGIGGGQLVSFTPPANPIAVQSTGGHVLVGVAGWYGSFQAMNSIPRLQVGYYPNVHRYSFHNPARGGMDWYGNGVGCNTVTGWFAVDEVAYNGDTITALDLRFELSCDNGAPLHGAVHWRG
jgi:hypothetical protein